MTKEELVAFEQDIAECFNRGEIRAPIHLDGGNEDQLIEIFKGVQPQDWVCGSWRMHYKCLLKGVPPARLKADILAGRSITLCYPNYRIISSAIVGGIIPIALGLAWSVKQAGGSEKVWCFVGDMTSCVGVAYECMTYALGYELPIRFVVEDNGISVCTPTPEVWGTKQGEDEPKAILYSYKLTWPHSGAGKRVNF